MLPLVSGNISLYGERLAVVLGFVTLAFGLMVALSCRSFPPLAARAGLKSLPASRAYQVFFRYHAYYWWFFGFLLVLHALTGLMHAAPLAGDPDAGIHWVVLGFALGTAAGAGVVYSSCRSFVSLVAVFSGRNLFNPFYSAFFRRHGYFWLAAVLLFAGHFASAYSHIGFWPGG